MEDLCSPFNWDFCHEEEGMEELWYSLLCRTLELETKVASAKEEITKKEDELLLLKDFLSRVIKEKDEAESKCQSIMLDIVTIQNQLKQNQQEEQLGGHYENGELSKESLHQLVDQHFASCETKEINNVINESCEGNSMDSVLQPRLSSSSSELPPSVEKLVAGKPLPEKGKLLQAVMEAGPLLQTLLLAGPLPQWQHPPPRINSVEIPPVSISRPPPQSVLGQEESCLCHKRSLPHYEGYGFSSDTKYQKVVLY
ncbi:hypothetical protein PanWU01x14_292390 [Parasponia andersonii]|uniref:Uncharacterized protein n=1 Tax=Parasponia andersonii TaxID=3476 RepID=A0A2P5AX34_PARAD|nr:hypothetical protein PanWU01x14_292390 [Parasponia andersonii]